MVKKMLAMAIISALCISSAYATYYDVSTGFNLFCTSASLGLGGDQVQDKDGTDGCASDINECASVFSNLKYGLSCLPNYIANIVCCKKPFSFLGAL